MRRVPQVGHPQSSTLGTAPLTMLDIEMSDWAKVSEEKEQCIELCCEAVTDIRRRVGFIPYIRHPHSYTPRFAVQQEKPHLKKKPPEKPQGDAPTGADHQPAATI